TSTLPGSPTPSTRKEAAPMRRARGKGPSNGAKTPPVDSAVTRSDDALQAAREMEAAHPAGVDRSAEAQASRPRREAIAFLPRAAGGYARRRERLARVIGGELEDVAQHDFTIRLSRVAHLRPAADPVGHLIATAAGHVEIDSGGERLALAAVDLLVAG